MEVLLDFDYRAFEMLNSLAGKSKAWDSFFVVVSEYTVLAMIAGLALFVVLNRRSRESIRVVFQALVAAFIARVILVSLIRMLFFRSRPFVEATVTQLVSHNPSEGAFPSGHAAVMFSVAFVVWSADRKWGTAYCMLALISGMARVIVGVHYPLDIVGGAVVAGLTVGFVKMAVSRRLMPHV